MEINNKEAVAAIAKANNEFTKKLYNELKKSPSSGENLVMSPFSVSAVVSMALTGAKGSTADQIRAGLSLPADEHLLAGYQEALLTLASNENFTLDSANKLYIQEGFKIHDAFLQTTSKNFHAEAEATNFANSEAARALINDFVLKKTNGKIQDLIQSGVLSALTRLVLINAIYFKGDWATKFDARNTRKGNFNLADGSKVETDLMFINSEFRSAEIPDIDAQALEMPYKGDRLAMILVLPNENLAKTESLLDGFDLGSIQFKRPAKVEVTLPKFKLESTHDLNQPLMKLGLTDMFDESKADFTGITANESLVVSSVVQKAFIEVNEEGSEAAAATAMMITLCCYMPDPQFTCDKPFMFFIKDNLSGLVLFAGNINNPTRN